MTYLIPGIVIDVSAILVAKMHFRVLGGGELKALLFCECSCAANIEHVRTCR